MRLDQIFYIERSLQLQDGEWTKERKPGSGSQIKSVVKTLGSKASIRVVAVGELGQLSEIGEAG